MIPVILAGGAGTRLWPKSRKFWPKFLLKFGNEHTLLQSTFLRLNLFAPAEKIFVITNKEHHFMVKENIMDLNLNFSEDNIIQEPEMKNTLPAVTIACKVILEKFNDEVVGIFPSDHYLDDGTKFSQLIRKSVVAAEKGNIVLFGVLPARLETGYGYIESAEKIPGLNCYQIKRFIEKPDVQTAEYLIQQENVFWNSGMFMFKPSVFLEEVKKFEPEIYNCAHNWDLKYESLNKIYPKMKNISIDKGVIEKSEKTVFAPFRIFWDDVGSWQASERIYKKDENSNVIVGKNVDLGSKNTVILGDRRVIATAGLENLVIVDTEDALLIISKNFSERVKELVGLLGKDESILYHKTTPRPWGAYTVLEHKNGFKIKLINVCPNKRLSLQKHHRRVEQWFVVSGKAKVALGNKEHLLAEGDKILIPKGVVHRLENVGKKVLEIVEISRGKYLGEDDIVRVQDDFLRK